MNQEATASEIAAPTQAVLYRQVSFDHVAANVEYIRRAVGIQPDRPAHQRWSAVVDEQLESTRRLVRPRAVYRVDRVRKLEQRRLELDSGAVYRGAVGQFLRHSEYVAVFVATIGSAMERLARRWIRGTRAMHGVIIDAIASETTEAAANLCEEQIREWAAERGLAITPRYSPGYCGMLVSQQRSVFASLPTRDIGVRLTPSCLMMPIKSLSGLLGIAPADKVGPNVYPCQLCDHPDCMQRRMPFEPNAVAEVDWAGEESMPGG